MNNNKYVNEYVKSLLKKGISYDNILEAFAEELDAMQEAEAEAAKQEEIVAAARMNLASAAKAYLEARGSKVDADFEEAMVKELKKLEKGSFSFSFGF